MGGIGPPFISRPFPGAPPFPVNRVGTDWTGAIYNQWVWTDCRGRWCTSDTDPRPVCAIPGVCPIHVGTG